MALSIPFLDTVLTAKNKVEEAFKFLNTYLEITGDYEGLKILTFYTIYRAFVRAKIALLSSPALALTQNKEFNQYLQYCKSTIHLQKVKKPKLILMHGISGSGKTTLANQIAPKLSAIIIRSDIERKRIFYELQKNQFKALYDYNTSKATFDRILLLVKIMLTAHFSVIVDATFLKTIYRKPYEELAEKLNVPYHILHCYSTIESLKQRVIDRFNIKKDASDATIEIVESQIYDYEPLTPAEMPHGLYINTEDKINIDHIMQHFD